MFTILLSTRNDAKQFGHQLLINKNDCQHITLKCISQNEFSLSPMKKTVERSSVKKIKKNN